MQTHTFQFLDSSRKCTFEENNDCPDDPVALDLAKTLLVQNHTIPEDSVSVDVFRSGYLVGRVSLPEDEIPKLT